MKNSIANQLRDHLASITKEEFAIEWAQVKSLGFVGPSAEGFVCSWNSSYSSLINKVVEPPKELAASTIKIPIKLTPDYRGLSFFSILAL